MLLSVTPLREGQCWVWLRGWASPTCLGEGGRVSSGLSLHRLWRTVPDSGLLGLQVSQPQGQDSGPGLARGVVSLPLWGS